MSDLVWGTCVVGGLHLNFTLYLTIKTFNFVSKLLGCITTLQTKLLNQGRERSLTMVLEKKINCRPLEPYLVLSHQMAL